MATLRADEPDFQIVVFEMFPDTTGDLENRCVVQAQMPEMTPPDKPPFDTYIFMSEFLAEHQLELLPLRWSLVSSWPWLEVDHDAIQEPFVELDRVRERFVDIVRTNGVHLNKQVVT